MGLPSVLVLTALLGARGSAAPPSETARELAYWRMVEEYASESKWNALSEVRSWPRADLQAVEDSIGELSKAARKCTKCEARARFEALPLRAAVLLHSERDRANRLVGIAWANDAPDCQAGPDGRLSERLLAHARLQSGGQAFAASFSVAMGTHHRALFCLPEADRWVRFGLKADPQDPSVLLFRGMVEETLGTLADSSPPPSTDRPLPDRRVPDLRFAQQELARRFGYRNLELRRASEAFLKALEITPELTIARLRLGRVQWRMGDLKQAEASLRRALAESDESSMFLARLFLGRVLEDLGSVEDAITQYEAAVALEPRAQAGAMALAHALILKGDANGARDILGPVLGRAGRQHEVNRYWNYLVGVPAMAEARFEELRVRAVR